MLHLLHILLSVFNNGFKIVFMYSTNTAQEIRLDFPITFIKVVNCIGNVTGYARWCEVRDWTISSVRLSHYTPTNWSSAVNGYNVIAIGF